jgi:hypothetical protein
MDKPEVAPVLESVGIKRAKQRRKYACLWCASSDALHAYERYVKCFSCGARGDAIDILRTARSLSYVEACKELGIRRNGFGRGIVPVDELVIKKERRFVMDTKKLSVLWSSLKEITGAPTSDEGKACVEYLHKHGVTLKRIVDYELPVRLIPKAEYWHALVKKAFGEVPDCLRYSSGKPMPPCPAIAYGYFNKCGLQQIRFRSLASKVRVSSMTGASTMLWDVTSPCAAYAPGEIKEIYVCEGEPDAMAMAARGMPAIGVPGAGLSLKLEDYQELLGGVPDRYVVLVQGDEAAKGWRTTTVSKLKRTGKPVWVYDCPDGFDVADMMAKHEGRALKAIKDKAIKAKPAWKVSDGEEVVR